MTTDLERARAFALKIWGKWDYDHEYGDRKDRECARSQHEAKLYSTEQLFLIALRDEREKTIDRCAEVARGYEILAPETTFHDDINFMVKEIAESILNLKEVKK